MVNKDFPGFFGGWQMVVRWACVAAFTSQLLEHSDSGNVGSILVFQVIYYPPPPKSINEAKLTQQSIEWCSYAVSDELQPL